MSCDNDASHSDSSAAASSSANKLDKTSDQLDVDHMDSDQSQDEGQARSRTTIIRDIVKVLGSVILTSAPADFTTAVDIIIIIIIIISHLYSTYYRKKEHRC